MIRRGRVGTHVGEWEATRKDLMCCFGNAFWRDLGGSTKLNKFRIAAVGIAFVGRADSCLHGTKKVGLLGCWEGILEMVVVPCWKEGKSGRVEKLLLGLRGSGLDWPLSRQVMGVAWAELLKGLGLGVAIEVSNASLWPPGGSSHMESGT